MDPEQGEDTAITWRRASRQVWRQGAFLAVLITTLALIALALGAAAAWLQAGRDEARSADLALLVAPAVPAEGLVEHAFELYRRGYVPTLLLTGEGQAGLKAQLVERGVPEAMIISDAAMQAETPDLRRLARQARLEGATSMLVVTAPNETLRSLKIARDQGLNAFGSPPPDAATEPLGLAGASLRYWRYVLFGL